MEKIYLKGSVPRINFDTVLKFLSSFPRQLHLLLSGCPVGNIVAEKLVIACTCKAARAQRENMFQRQYLLNNVYDR